MKWISFEHRGRGSYGVVVKNDQIVDLGRHLGDRYPTLKRLIAAEALGEASRLAAGASPDFPLDQVTLLPPITDPDKILALALNYRQHAAEIGATLPAKPAIFMRTADSLVAHEQPLLKVPESDMFDWEVELCLIIGRGGRRIKAEDALSHVAGYTIMNEGTMRDWLRHSSILTPGKNFYHSGSVGPWMVDAAAIPDPEKLRLRTRLNGAMMQDSNTSDLIFGIGATIEYLSIFTPLSPGDLIATGTPSGVGVGRKPQLFLKPGDKLEFEIENIGVLRNPVVAEG